MTYSRPRISSGISYLLVFCMSIIGGSVFGITPDHQIDSLNNVLRNTDNDTVKFETNIRLCGIFHEIDAEISLTFGLKALTIANEHSIENWRAEAYTYMGRAYWAKGETSREISSYYRALNIYKTTQHLPKLAGSHIHVGNVLLNYGDYDDAFEHYKAAEKIYTKTKPEDLSTLQIQFGNYYSAVGKLDSADYYFDLAQQHLKENGNFSKRVIILGNIGLVCAQRQEYERAVNYLTQAIDLRDSTHNRYLISGARVELGGVYLKMGMLDKAEIEFLKALHLANQLRTAEWHPEVYLGLYKTEKARGNLSDALEYYEFYHELKDSISKRHNEHVFQLVKQQYESDKKDQLILNLKQEIRTNNEKLKQAVLSKRIIALIILIGVLITLFVVYILQKRKKDKARLEHLVDQKTAQLKDALSFLKEEHMQAMKFHSLLLSSQMNPHFIFNSLNSVQFYILDQNVEPAINYISEFSGLMRLTLDNSNNEAISIEDEIVFLEKYMKLEQERFSHKFDYEITIGDDVFEDEVMIPPMLLQPIIENTIVHGIRNKEGKGMIKIEFDDDEDTLICAIEDDGVGREVEEMKKQLRRGDNFSTIGMNISQTRLDLLNKIYNNQFSMSIDDLKDDAGNAIGTRIELRFPIDLYTKKD